MQKQDKFKLFKSKRFKIALKHNVSYIFVLEKKEPFVFKLPCDCIEEYNPGWYKWVFSFGYVKLEDL